MAKAGIFRRGHWRMGAALLALVAVAGCGGGGGSVGTAPVPQPTPTPTPAPTPTPTPAPTPTPTPSTSFQTTEYNRSTGPSQHGAIPAWSAGFNGAGVTIGIVDSGIDSDSPEFAGRIASASRDVAGARGLDNPDSDHGTNVALVAAAARDNTGMMGIAFSSTIAMFRADTAGTCATVDPNDPDSGCSFSDSSIAQGVISAIGAGAKVINLSLGGSPPNATLRDAIARAAAAGIVVVISAGNDGDSTDPDIDPNNPDPFAAGLRGVGNGNVIIAGSVDAANLISDFSNRAGSEAAWYLSARGERVCCVHENGVMKVVTNPDGSRSVFVFSGTSFSAPQIAGAAALLLQAFPNLTATQVVDLLLRSARDAGAAGTDPIYGRGLLDITAAFAPQGTTSLAGSTIAMPLSGTTGVTSAPMGDARGKTTGLGAVVLDDYGRAYRVDLAAGLRGAELAPKLAPALAAETRHVTLGNEQLSLAFSVDGRGRVARLPWQGQLNLSLVDADRARVLAARVVAKIAPDAKLGFAFSQGSDGLVAQLQGRQQPAFLIARSPLDNAGFGQSDELSFALRQQFGQWGLSLSAERGSAVSTAPGAIGAGERIARNRAGRIGVAMDRSAGPATVALGASWLSEERSLLGARLHEGFGPGGAQSLLVDASGEWRFAPGWQLGAAWRSGWTWAKQGGVLAAGSRLKSSAWSLDVARAGLLQADDTLALRLAQPLRVESGGLLLRLPVGYSYATLQPDYALVPLSLAPRGRELDAELVWRGAVRGGQGLVSFYYRRNPGHYAAIPADQGVAVSWNRAF